MANKKNLLIIGAMVVVTVLAFLLINFFSGKGSSSSPSEVTEENLQQEIIELEQNLLALEVIFDGKEEQIDQLDDLLQESYDRLASAEKNVEKLEDQLKELERRGKVDKQTIAKLRNQLNEKKTKINEEKLKAYKVEIDLLVRDNGMLTAVRDSLEIVQYQKDSLITEMRTQVEDCMTANTNTRPPVQVDEPPVVPGSNNTRASGFYAYNINPILFDKKGKILPRGSSAKDVERIEFKMDVEGVDPVPRGRQDIYIEIVAPGKSVITNQRDNGGSGGSFTIDGKQKIYTLKTYLNFQGKNARVSTEYLTGKSFPGGKSTVYIYCNNKKIGEKTIILST